MEKTEMMKEFQAKTGIKAMVMVKNGTLVLPSLTVRASQQFFPSEEYIDWLEAKATAYDRVISSGLSMKELANILKHPVAIENEDDQNELYYFDSTPYISQFSDGTQFWSCKRKWRLPRQLVNFCDIWEYSLTLPDGWEEKQ